MPSLSNLTDCFRSFTDRNQRWKEGCDIYVEGVRVSGKIQKTIQCTGKVSGIKLRHEGELKCCLHGCQAYYVAVWRSALAYPHTEHPRGDIGNIRTVSFLGLQVLYEQTQPPPEEILLKKDVCYTFADPEGMIDKVRL